MQFIPMNILEYRLNEDGITETIIVAFQSYQGSEQFNARVSLTDEYVKERNKNHELDTLNKVQIESYAKAKLREWISVQRPEEEPAEEE